jgi:hypothetical protein
MKEFARKESWIADTSEVDACPTKKVLHEALERSQKGGRSCMGLEVPKDLSAEETAGFANKYVRIRVDDTVRCIVDKSETDGMMCSQATAVQENIGSLSAAKGSVHSGGQWVVSTDGCYPRKFGGDGRYGIQIQLTSSRVLTRSGRSCCLGRGW